MEKTLDKTIYCIRCENPIPKGAGVYPVAGGFMDWKCTVVAYEKGEIK